MQWKEKERFISQLTHNYPVDSGVRIPPAELYRVPQGELGNLKKSFKKCCSVLSVSKEGEFKIEVILIFFTI